MLTRLKIHGFKNLLNVDIRFGPFTCIAGENGVGKSNIFDVIQFLSFLADKPFTEAAGQIRSRENIFIKGGAIQNIFHKVGSHTERRMEFEAEMIIPKIGEDELGQVVAAGNPNGTAHLVLPAINKLERISDPKRELIGLLEQASGLNRRRLRKFRPHSAIHTLAENIEDYSALRNLTSFQNLEFELNQIEL